MSTTQSNCNMATLGVSFELGWGEWKLAFSTTAGAAPRLRAIAARNVNGLLQEIAKAKARFGLASDAPVVSCYEAGRDGFWLHRWLTTQGIQNFILDSSSIERPRRKQAKTDRLDAVRLVQLLWRYLGGEHQAVRIVQVPSGEDEDRRHVHRDLITLKGERTQHVNRIKGLLAACGLAIEIDATLLDRLATLHTWDGQPLRRHLMERVTREFGRWQLVDQQIRDLEKKRVHEVQTAVEGEERV